MHVNRKKSPGSKGNWNGSDATFSVRVGTPQPRLYSLQLAFSDLGGEGNTPPPAPDTQTVAAHSRNKPAKSTPPAEDGLFFDESKLPVETITLPCKEAEGLDPEQYEVVSEKVSHRLAQRPASYVILKYVRPVIKLKETQTLVCAPAPQGVLDNSRADVSFLAGMVVDKFLYHQPLYRQHQRLGSNGVTVSRPWLTQLTHAALMLKYIVPMLILTGARKREVLDAKWEDFDVVRKQWRIPVTKTGRPRHVPLSEGVLQLLDSIPHDDCPWVFANPKTRKPFVSIFTAWNTARKKAELSEVRIHDLRHSFASFLVNAGRSLYEVQKILGHTQVKTTQRYAHLSQDTLLDAANEVSKAVPLTLAMPKTVEQVALVRV